MSLEEAQEVVEDRDGVATRTAWPSPYIVMSTRMRPTHYSRGNNAEFRTVRKFPHLPKYGHARLGEGGF